MPATQVNLRRVLRPDARGTSEMADMHTAGSVRDFDRFRPDPSRGDLIAAGAVPLTLALLMLNERMTQWGLGPKFVILGLGCLLLLGAAVFTPPERPEGPRPWHSVLLVTGLVLLAATL